MRLAAAAAVTALTALGPVGLAGAGAPPSLVHTAFYAPAGRSNTVEVAVDRHGIAPADAQLIEEGKPGNRGESAREFRLTGHGVTAVLAIDASGSVKGGPFESVKAALRDFVSSSRPQDRIAVVSFADTVVVAQAFTSDKAQLTQAIGALQAGGNLTLLNRAIADSLTLLAAEKTNARQRLLVITDGKNEGPGPVAAALETEARRLGIPVDCLGVTRLAARFLLPMQSLAAASGGAYVRARDYEDLRNAMREGIEGLLGTPVLTFRLAHIAPDGASHLLQLKIEGSTTDAVQMFLPRTAPAMLYVPAVLALLLFGAGMALIVFGRRRRRAAAAADTPPDVPAVAEPDPPARTRTQTVYAPKSGPRTPYKGDVRRPPPPRPEPVPPPPAPVPDLKQPTPQPVRDATQFRQVFAQPAPGKPTAWVRAQGSPTRFPIEADEVWIGSGDGNHIRVAEDMTMSRNHACIQWIAGDLYLFDNRSTNGTRVNGRRMESGSRARLQAGDQIAAGHAVFSLEA